MRQLIPINFSWYVKVYEEKHLKSIDLKSFKKVDIPNQPFELDVNYFKLKDIHQKFSYVYHLKNIDLTKYKSVNLLFEGVAIESDIYVNKNHVGHHVSGYTPFSVEISKYINHSLEEQEILVVVSGLERKDVPPFGGVVDYLGYVGIYREVYLDLIDTHYIKDVHMYSLTPLENNELSLEVETSYDQGILEVEVFDIEHQSILKESFVVKEHHNLLKLNIKSKKLWSLENPYLYQVKVSYHQNDEIWDTYSHKFGFRTLDFRSDGFYLNGRLKKLIGLNRHQSFPYQGYAMPKSAQKEDADILKRKLGLDMVRSSHYPCSKHFLNRADEIGLLVIEEIPGWQYIGNETFKEITYMSLKNMIHRDKNHASVCLWGVRINESADDHDFYTKTNEIARSLDPYRQTCGIRNLDKSDFLEDVYTYNDFSHAGHNKGLMKKKEITHKDAPYLITEHNGHMFPTKPYDSELKRLEHAKRHLRVLDDMMDPKNGISGSIGWVMSDYHTHPEFGSGDGICYHGVTDINRMPKMASYGYLSQNENPFVLEISSNMNLGDYPGGYIDEVYIFTNLDSVKLYKNEILVDTFYPNYQMYPNLKHPPVVITDFIGKTLREQEKMSYLDAEKVKKIIKYVSKSGTKFPLKYKLQMLFLLKKYKMTFDEGIQLFYKYTSGWGDEFISYRFEGYKEGVKVKEVIKTYNEEFLCTLKSNKSEMTIGETYDTMRFELRCHDSHQSIKSYAFDPVEIHTSEDIELIGPKTQSLQAGQLAFWIRSTKKGKATLKVKIRDQVIEKEVLIK